MTNLASKIAVLSIGIALCGCNNKPTQVHQDPVNDQPNPPYSSPPDVKIATPTEVETEGFYLIRGNSKLYFGELEDKSFEIFAKPQGGIDFLEDSPIRGDSYSSRGWQTTKESFAGVFLRDRLVLGMHTIELPTLDKVNQLVDEYSHALSPASAQLIPSEVGNCWFWEQGNRRLMIANTRDGKKRNQLVIALGHKDLMDSLRMNPDATRQDLFEAGRILDKK